MDPNSLKDPIWRISNLYSIVGKRGKVVPFRPNQQQLQFLRDVHGWDLILKARQLGFTTLAGIVAVDEAVFNPNWTCEIIAHTEKAAKKILREQVKFPYDSLPEAIRSEVYPVSDSADTLALSNGSRVSVSTSSRGGTLQRLHISEFGKICARNPDRANEIISGSLPAAEFGHITIESTAEGQDGHFYNMTQKALTKMRMDESLTKKDFLIHFYPWWDAEEYRMDPAGVFISDRMNKYFDGLEIDIGRKIDEEQRAWYVKQEEIQGALMKREYPATPEEAFEQALEGAYFEAQLAHSESIGAIGRYPYDPRYPVNTFWDLGRNDLNAIWFHQHIGGRNRFVHYYENSGEHISHYVQEMNDFHAKYKCRWGDHYWPHDGRRQDLFLEEGRLGVIEEYGLHPIIVPRVSNKLEAIEAARNVFPQCDFDRKGCEIGLKRLKHYRKEWDEARGTWKDKPHHGPESNGADAFLTFASGYRPDEVDEYERHYEPRGRSDATGY